MTVVRVEAPGVGLRWGEVERATGNAPVEASGFAIDALLTGTIPILGAAVCGRLEALAGVSGDFVTLVIDVGGGIGAVCRNRITPHAPAATSAAVSKPPASQTPFPRLEAGTSVLSWIDGDAATGVDKPGDSDSDG